MSVSHLRGLLLAAASVTAVACATDQPTGPATNDLASRVIALGFSSKGMQDHGDYVVVEGDIRLDKAPLLNSAPSNPTYGKGVPNRPTYQYNTNAIVSRSYVTHIVVDLTNIASVSDWANAARNAMADYNSSGSAIHMSEGSPGDITFSSAGTLNGYIAVASWPYQGSPSGKPGPTITVSQVYDSTYNVGQKEKVLVHELGHTLGLRHDNALQTEGAGSIGANLIFTTIANDPSSVMVTPYDGSPWSGFDQYDLNALKMLYNPITATITGPTLVANGHWCTWNVNATGGVPPYTYSWQVQEPAFSYFSPQSTNQSTQSSFLTEGNNFSGSFPMTVIVFDSGGWSNTVGTFVNDTGFGGSYDHTYCS